MAHIQMTAQHVSFRARGLGLLMAAAAAAAAIGIGVASAAADPVPGCTTQYGTYQNCSTAG